MTPAVIEIMKSTVQLGTKIACAHFICLVTVHIGADMTPLVGKYLTAFLNGLSDRNTTVRKYYASAIGHLVGVAKEQSVAKLFEKLSESYFDPESTKAKAIPQTIHAIHKKHPELLKDFAPNVIPLIFFAMHEEITDENKQNVEHWKDVWHEVSVGDVGIKFNLDSIIARLEKCFENQQFTLKAQSAKSINTIATRLGSDLSDSHRRQLINLLLVNTTGRTYDGKENILQALASLSKSLQKTNDDLHNRMTDAVMKEVRKKDDLKYKVHALKAFGTILESLEEDRFEELYKLVWFIMEKTDLSFGDDDVTDMTAEEKSKQILVLTNLKEAVCESLAAAWPVRGIETQQKYQLLFAQKCAECLQTNTRQVQLSLAAALGKFLDKLNILNIPPTAEESIEKRVKIESDPKELNEVIATVISAIVNISSKNLNCLVSPENF